MISEDTYEMRELRRTVTELTHAVEQLTNQMLNFDLESMIDAQVPEQPGKHRA